MWLNILIAVVVGVLTYAGTLMLDSNTLSGRHLPAGAADAPLLSGDINDDSNGKNQNNAQNIVPEFSFTTTDNSAMQSIQDFRGKTIILNFWASWCPPCVKEFPVLLDIAQQNTADVVLLAVSSDFDSGAMNRFLSKMEPAVKADNVLIIPDAENQITQGVFKTFRLPETILIDKNGVMRHKISGADWSQSSFQDMIDALKK